jgi:hypothetical protein
LNAEHLAGFVDSIYRQAALKSVFLNHGQAAEIFTGRNLCNKERILHNLKRYSSPLFGNLQRDPEFTDEGPVPFIFGVDLPVLDF